MTIIQDSGRKIYAVVKALLSGQMAHRTKATTATIKEMEEVSSLCPMVATMKDSMKTIYNMVLDKNIIQLLNLIAKVSGIMVFSIDSFTELSILL